MRILLRAGACLRELPVAGVLLACEHGLRRLRVDIGLGRADGRLLQELSCREARERRLPLRHDRGRAVDRGPEVAIIEFDEHLPRAHMIIVRNQDLRDETGDMRRDRRDVATHIGVVGGLEEASDAPPLIGVADGAEHK